MKANLVVAVAIAIGLLGYSTLHSSSRAGSSAERAGSRQLASTISGADLAIKTDDHYTPLIDMLSSFIGENLHTTPAHDFLITYLTEDQRLQHRVVIKGNSNDDTGPYIYDSTGQSIDDQVAIGGIVIVPNLSQNGEYVMDAAGNFYLLNEEDVPTIRHSSIFDGKPIAGAGEVKIKNGRILTLNSKSGHYPTDKNPKCLENVLAEIKTDGVALAPDQVSAK